MSARIADYVVRVSRVGDRGENLKSPAEQRARVEQAAAREGVTLRHGLEELDTSGGAALDKRPVCWQPSGLSSEARFREAYLSR